MKKTKDRFISLFMVAALITSIVPLSATAYATGGSGHTHDDSCYASEGDLLCGLTESEGHAHSESCYCPGGELLCGLEQVPGHTHGETCYDENGNLVCTETESESHTHSEECYCPGGELTCSLEESEGHTHSEGCYAAGGELICGLEETPDGGIMPLDLVWDGSEILTEQDLLDAFTYASDGDTLKLGADVTYDASALGRITVDKSITLDFNGYILRSAGGTFQQSLGGWDDAFFDIAGTGSLTLVNAQIQTGTFNIVNGSRTSTWIGDFIGESKGAVTVQSTGQLGINAYNFIYENYGLVDIKTGTFHCEDFIDSSYEDSQIKVEDGTFYLESCFVDNTESTEIIIENCDITAGSYCFDDMYDTTFLFKNGSVKSDSSCFYVYSGGDSLITIENGSFESETGNAFCNYADSASGSAKLIIYDGTFITHECEVIYNDGEVEIYGGTFVAKNDQGYSYSAVYTEGDEGFGTVTLYGGDFSTGDGTPAFETYDGGTIVIAEGHHTEPAEWQTSDSVKVIPNIITVTFHAEDSVVSTATDNPSNLVFPDAPTHSQGYEFRYWEKEDHTPVFDLSALRGDTDLYAVFSDRTYTITFNDKGELSEELVIAGTPLGEVPGLDRADNGDLFSSWKLDGVSVNSDTTIPVCSDLTLIAIYQGMVMDYAELIEALNNKEEVIILGADIIVEDTVIVNYECTITSFGKFGLIRPNDFLGVLLTTQTGVAGGEEIEGVTTSAFTLTLDNVLVDGRNIEADKPAVLVDERTTLVLKDSTIQNNFNNASGWYDDQGGGICNKGTLKMYDGTIIRNNQAAKGGGVFNAEPIEYLVNREWVYYPVTFYMYGGEISGNTALDNSTSCNAAGGGVNVDGRWSTHAEFFMYGGKITGNSAPNGCGGGVSLCCGDQPVFDTEDREAQVVFTMYGGEITDNTTGESGGGVWVACSSFAMENGLISRNTAAEDGGGIGACCGCEMNANITGGTITLNAAKKGGGIGKNIGGVIKPDAIYDNLASETGDDIVYENYSNSVVVLNRLPSRPYGESYKSESTLSEMMQQLVQNAKKNLDVELLADYPEPTGVMIPFLGWFIDGNTRDSDVPRYNDESGDKHDLSGEVLDWATVDKGNAVKAIWQGIVLLYDANYEGSTDYQYDPQGYLPGNDATVLANMFTRSENYKFIGWNTQADGLGTAYADGDQILMEHSQVLYAQWEKLPTYRVSYIVTGDPIYGIPADGNAPVDVNSPYIQNAAVTVLPDATTAWTTSDGTESGRQGTWTFSGWDKEDFVISSDTEIRGNWVFTPSKGNLTVRKTISGNGADATKEFTFTVTLDDTSISGTYGDIVFADGIATFKLKADESKTASDLPAGVEYTVSESDNSGYTVTVNNSDATNASGTILKGETAAVAFNNHKDSGGDPSGGDPGSGSSPDPAKVTLHAEKTLDGLAPRGNRFTFVLKDQDGNVVQTANNVNGDINFKSLSFSKAGTYVYTISESAGTDSTIHYDSAVYTVRIRVTKSGDYTATVSYEKNGQPYDGTLTFANTTKSGTDPVDPVNPTDPDTPSIPTNPTDPGTPNVPSVPADPAAPVNPTVPTVPTDPDRPVDHVPKTDDESRTSLWFAIMASSLFGAAVTIFIGRKEERKFKRERKH